MSPHKASRDQQHEGQTRQSGWPWKHDPREVAEVAKRPHRDGRKHAAGKNGHPIDPICKKHRQGGLVYASFHGSNQPPIRKRSFPHRIGIVKGPSEHLGRLDHRHRSHRRPW